MLGVAPQTGPPAPCKPGAPAVLALKEGDRLLVVEGKRPAWELHRENEKDTFCPLGQMSWGAPHPSPEPPVGCLLGQQMERGHTGPGH